MNTFNRIKEIVARYKIRMAELARQISRFNRDIYYGYTVS